MLFGLKIKEILDFWKKLVAQANSKGVPLPLVRDPKTGRGDVALTLVVLSSIYVQIGLLGKYSKMLEGVDLVSALNWFFGCCALYWARKLSKDEKGYSIGDAVPPSQPPEQKEDQPK